MAEKLAGSLVALMSGLTAWRYGRHLIVFIISLMPILELRGGLIAASLLGLDPVSSYIVSMIGNILPIPFILLFINWILAFMRKSLIGFVRSFAGWLDKKVEKHKGQIERWGFWGLVLFVGVPLPGTGAWTGCLIASVLHMDRKKAFGAALIGVFMASIIMMIVSFGLIGGIKNAL